MECGKVLAHEHFQMVVRGDFSSLLELNNKIKVCLRWDVSPPTSHVVTCKRLRDEGLRTFLGMVGYCMKDNEEEHSKFVHYHTFDDDMINGKIGVC